MKNVSTLETLTLIRRYADRQDGTLTLLLGESPELSSGARSALGQCIDTNKLILEVLNDHESQVPSLARSITKAENVLGKSVVHFDTGPNGG